MTGQIVAVVRLCEHADCLKPATHRVHWLLNGYDPLDSAYSCWTHASQGSDTHKQVRELAEQERSWEFPAEVEIAWREGEDACCTP